MQAGEDPLSFEFLDGDPAKSTFVVTGSHSTPLPGNDSKQRVVTTARRDGTTSTKPGRVSTSTSIPSSPSLPHRMPLSPPSLTSSQSSSSSSSSTRSPLSPTTAAFARVPRVDILRESRIHQTFQYPGGKLKSVKVGFAEYGPPDGHPAFVIGGHGCTRLVGVMFEELAIRYNIHMIWPERPGYGLSEECNAQEFNAIAWAEVIIQLADHLNIRRFSIIAQSVGTVFAMAVAHSYPSRVLGPLFLISPWVSTYVANTFKWSRRLPAALVTRTVSLALDVMWMFNKTAPPMSKENNTAIAATSTQDEADHRSTFSETSPRSSEATSPGKRSMTDVSWMTAMEEDELLASLEEDNFDLPTDFPPHRPLRHAVRPRHMSLYFAMNQLRMSEPHSQGQLLDVLIALEKYHSFGFNYSDIKMAVTAVWGDKDGLIPLRAIEALANGLRDVRLKILDGEGHDLVWKEGVMEWALRGTFERWKSRIRAVKAMSTHINAVPTSSVPASSSSSS